MIDLKAIRAFAECANLCWPPKTKIETGRWNAIDIHVNTMTPQTVIALLDRLEAAEAQLTIYEKHGVTCQIFRHKLTGCAECNRDDAMESVNETNAVLANNYLELLPKLEAAEKDAARLQWLIDNDVDAAELFATTSGTFIRREIDDAMKDEQK